jgi:hypothetical protein
MNSTIKIPDPFLPFLPPDPFLPHVRESQETRMNARTRSAILLIPSLCVASLTGLNCCSANETLANVAKWRWKICDGEGNSRPFLSEKDYFTLFAEALHDPEQKVRVVAAMDVKAHSHFSGTEYSLVVDAYIHARRDEELARELLEAWAQSQRDSDERLCMAEAWLDLRMRQYLWDHPECASEARVYRWGRSWSGFSGPRVREFFAERLLAGGDEQFRTVWEDYQHQVRCLKAGTLKEIDWGPLKTIPFSYRSRKAAGG